MTIHQVASILIYMLINIPGRHGGSGRQPPYHLYSYQHCNALSFDLHNSNSALVCNALSSDFHNSYLALALVLNSSENTMHSALTRFYYVHSVATCLLFSESVSHSSNVLMLEDIIYFTQYLIF